MEERVYQEVASSITVYFVNNAGGGFAGPREIPQGTTAIEMFHKEMGEVNPADYKISLNGMTPPQDRVLENEDTFVITPLNIGGSV